ncbi:MAG: Uncharacterized protein XD63_0577 [Thermoanaerobacterales bacterium 50_218]|nr:MAG: Uncharacterized protein XD63_0577 [Thermoanaerobacterales bacterium 50_218]HAA89102.1 hypothetical protein [Peptococcaceae bacterium]
MSWKDLLIGCCWGILVGFFNIWLLSWVLKKHHENSPEVSLRAIFKCYLFRYLTVLAALCIVYRSADMLVGTALGLIVVKHGTLFQEYLRTRREAEKVREKNQV